MKVLILGSGARESAIARRLREEGDTTLFFMGQNVQMESFATRVDLSDNPKAIADWAESQRMALVIPGTEEQIKDGIVDVCLKEGVECFGPVKEAANIGTSRFSAASIAKEAGIPMPETVAFSDYIQACRYLDKGFDWGRHHACVIKCDGVADSRPGVFIAHSLSEGKEILKSAMFNRVYGAGGKSVLVQPFLEGIEVSATICIDRFGDSQTLPVVATMSGLQNNNVGSLTAGMGAVCPHPRVTAEIEEEIKCRILWPVIAMLDHMGTPYQGFLTARVILTEEGPKAVGFRPLPGDPELQTLLARLDQKGPSFTEFLLAAAEGHLQTLPPLRFRSKAVSLVLTARGYPTNKVRTGMQISGLVPEAESPVSVFHADTCRKRVSDASVCVGDGRVVCLTAASDALPDAIGAVYAQAEKITFEGMHYRTDLGRQVI